MEFCLILLSIFYMQAYSYETFIKSVKGKTNIECNQNFFIVTNETTILKDCYLKNSCSIPADRKIHYVCIPREYLKTRCHLANNFNFFPSTGCFYGRTKGWNRLSTVKYPHRYLHFLVLSKKLKTDDGSGLEISHPVFSYVRLERSDSILTDENSWFLLKVSNESKEDFREFLAESSQITTQATTEGINTFSTITIHEDKTSSTTVAPNEKQLSIHKVLIIVGIVIDLLTISLLAAFVFYRKRPRKETGNGIRVIPLVENERTGNSLADNTVTHQQFNNRRGINVANETPLAENQYDRLSDVPEYTDCI